MSSRPPIVGVVLAGGLGRRMSADGSGVDKALVTFQGRPLITHVIERLRPQVESLLVNGDGDEGRWRALDLRQIPDQLPGRPGPLAGLHAGMLAAAPARWVACAPCDTPFLPADLVEQLWQAREPLPDGQPTGGGYDGDPPFDVAVARCRGRLQPTFMLARAAMHRSIARYLDRGGRAIEGWLREQSCVCADFDDEHVFANLNTPQELRGYE